MGVKVTFLRSDDAASPAATAQAQPVTLVPKAAVRDRRRSVVCLRRRRRHGANAAPSGSAASTAIGWRCVAGLRPGEVVVVVAAGGALEWCESPGEVEDSIIDGHCRRALVKVRDVHKHFTRGSERIDVLKGVNLDIPQGDFLALMGPSGPARRRCST